MNVQISDTFFKLLCAFYIVIVLDVVKHLICCVYTGTFSQEITTHCFFTVHMYINI